MTAMINSAVRFEKRANAVGWYWRSAAPLKALRAHVRGLSTTFFKSASIGGEQESGFEQAFSSLAYAYLKDKSPRLIDYIVGFQLVDRNEDNTKAMGVFGFKVGDQWLYGPTFFLNGDLKGHELLYIKKQDAFVPMKENWVNHLISRKPHMLGEASSKDTFQLGGMPPDISRFSQPPGSSKYGADAYRPDLQDWAKPFVAFIGAAATRSERVFHKHASLASSLDLGNFLSLDASLLQGAWELTRRYPLIKSAFERFYGRDFFLSTAANLLKREKSLLKAGEHLCATRPKKTPPALPASKGKVKLAGSLIPFDPAPPHPLESGALRITAYDPWDTARDARPPRVDMPDLLKLATPSVDEEAPGGIVEHVDVPTQKEQEKLLRDGVAISDTREDHEKSVVYNTQVRLELINPGDTGVYEVLEKPGAFDDMLVISHPQTNRGREMFCTVVRLSDPRNWLNTHSSNLWVQASPKPDRQDFKAWFDKQSDARDLQKGGHYLAIGPNGAGTTPFRVRESYGDGAYRVEFLDRTAYGKDKPTWLRHRGYEHGLDYLSDGYDYVSNYDGKLFFNEREGSSLRSVQGELSVPANFKVVKLQDPPEPDKDEGPSLISCCFGGEDPGASSAKRPVRPGNLIDIQLLIHEKTAQLKILDRGCEVYLKRSGGYEERMGKKAALISLVRDHGCTEADARAMLKHAAAKGSGVWRIKYADGFGGPNRSSLEGGPGAPAFPEPMTGTEQVGYGAVPSIYPQEQFQQVPDMSSSQTDPTIYDPFYPPDQQAMQMAQEAGQSGQKEVFDTAMISGMLKAVRQDSLVDRYLGDLMKALDKLGRILFMFYWHQEEFEDRYGKQDLPEMEDSLRNAFETLGDVVLFLEEKQVGGGMQDFSGVGGGGGGRGEPSIEEAARN